MPVPKFAKIVNEGGVFISMESGDDTVGTFMLDEAEGTYLDFSKPLTEKQILNALSQAYKWGYEEAVADAQEAVRRVLYERKTEYAPRPRIARTENRKSQKKP